MKKIILAFVVVMFTIACANAQAQSDAFFQAGNSTVRGSQGTDEPMVVPNGAVGTITDHDAAPLGTGLLVLTALGAGYAVTKRKK